MGINVKTDVYVERCLECPNGAFEKGKYICCDDRLSYKKYPAGREVKNFNTIPEWCPYKKKGKKK